MRMLVIIVALVTMLNACTSTGTITPESVAAEIKKDCGIIVTVVDIAALISSDPAVTTVAGFANMVCNAFKAQASAPTGSGAGGIIIVNKIPVHYTLQ